MFRKIFRLFFHSKKGDKGKVCPKCGGTNTEDADLNFVCDRSIPIIARLAELEMELETANKKVNDFRFPNYVSAPKEPVKYDFFFGIGYKAACEAYREKLSAWEKDNEKYKEAKSKANAEADILESNRAKIHDEIKSLQNDNSRQNSLYNASETWNKRPSREYKVRAIS